MSPFGPSKSVEDKESAALGKGQTDGQACEDASEQELRHSAQAIALGESLSDPTCGEDHQTIDDQPDKIEQRRKYHDLSGHRAGFRVDELWEQRQHEEGHLGIKNVGE